MYFPGNESKLVIAESFIKTLTANDSKFYLS